MPNYVDGFVIPVPAKNLAAYRRIARRAAAIWREYGALDYRECVGNDLAVNFGRTFPKALKLKRGETVIFSWIEYKSKAHRDRVNARVMKDPRLAGMCDPKNSPFNVTKMLYGGFEVIVS